MAWLLLLLGGGFEIVSIYCLKRGENFSNLKYSIAFLLTAPFSYWFLSLSTKSIPIGTAYSVWTGIGAFGTAIIGIFLFKEDASFWRLFFIFTIIISVIGLKISV